jgi:hypothetical protein
MVSMSCAHAWGPDFQSARTLSLSQGGRAGALMTDTIVMNPSMLGFQPLVAFSGTGFWQREESSNRGFNLGVVDGKNELFTAGLSFTRARQFNIFHLSAAKKVFQWLSLGAHGKRYSSRSTTPLPAARGITGYDGGLSATVSLPKGALPLPLNIALTSDNLLSKSGHEESIGPRQVAVGAKTSVVDVLIFYLDYVQYLPENFPSYGKPSLGGELSITPELFARVSAFGFRERGWGLGAGWLGPRVALNYGYQRQNQLPANRGFTHAISLDVFL